MPEFKRFPKGSSRQIMSIDRILSLTGDKMFVCLDRGFIELCKYLALSRGLWRTSYAYDDSQSESGYMMPTASEFEPVESLINEGVIDMASCDEITQAINDLVHVMATSQGCGCGTNGGGSTSPPLETTDTGDITQPTGTPPGGYAAWTDYQQAKCDVANWIIDSLYADVLWMISNQALATVMVGLIAGLSIPIAGTALAIILGVALAIAGYEWAILEYLKDAIVNSRSNLLCALMGGTDAAGSQGDFESALTTAIAAETSDPIAQSLLYQLGIWWVDSTTVNLLYGTADEVAAQNIPQSASDCSECGLDCSNFYIVYGEWLGGDTFSSENLGSEHNLTIYFNADNPQLDCTGFCGPEENISLSGLTGWTAKTSSLDSFRIWDDTDCPITSTNAGVYSSDTAPDSSVRCGRRLTIFSTTAFTINIDRQGGC